MEAQKPDTVNLLLSGILIVCLVNGLYRVWRVLRSGERFGVLRHIPDGMRAVQCGSCRTVQYATLHGRILVCFSCQASSRIPVSLPEADGSEARELIRPTGPRRCFEFKKLGENLWHELKREEIPEGQESVDRRSPLEPTQGSSNVGDLNSVPDEGPRNELSGTVVGEPTIIGRSTGPLIAGQVPDPDIETISRSESIRPGELPMCVVCLDAIGDMVLLPCSHGGVCQECTTRIAQNRASGGAHCPHCRSGIETLVKLREINQDIAKGEELRIPMARPQPTRGPPPPPRAPAAVVDEEAPAELVAAT